MRAVIDTNILVRAVLKPQGSAGQILDCLRDARFLYLYSDATLNELIDVLGRPRMVSKYGVTPELVEATCSLLLLRGESVQSVRDIRVCRDPKDDKFLQVAISGQAEVVVTADEDLIVLGSYEAIPMVQPAEFLRRLAGRAES